MTEVLWHLATGSRDWRLGGRFCGGVAAPHDAGVHVRSQPWWPALMWRVPLPPCHAVYTICGNPSVRGSPLHRPCLRVARKREYWSLVHNGEVFPEVTIEELPLGHDTMIEVRNISSSEHPFHLHGHGFEVVARNGGVQFRQMEDTINVSIFETVLIRLIADNPGIGCCIATSTHQWGMMTVLRVAGMK